MGQQPINPIGYYVHHHGSGHLRRALNITRQLPLPVVLFSSLDAPATLPANVRYIQLPSDVIPGYQAPPNTTLHYTPYGQAVFDRNQILIDAWQRYHISHLYVDVSAEVALLAKLYGLHVGHAVMHGDRIDPAHHFLYDSADYLLAHMAHEFDDPAGRHTETAVHYSGGISRYKKRQPVAVSRYQNIVVLSSPKAEQSLTDQLITIAKQTPHIQWHYLGSTDETGLPNLHNHGLVPDPRPWLEQADLIIGAAGNNTIMEVASLGKPFICLPEDRPFDEQRSAARALKHLNAAVVLDSFPTVEQWPDVLQAVRRLDLTAFSGLVNDNAAKTAAAIIAAQHPS